MAPAHLHNSGCCSAGFCVIAEVHVSSCPLWPLCSACVCVCVCVARPCPQSKRQADLQLFEHATDRAEERDRHRDEVSCSMDFLLAGGYTHTHTHTHTLPKIGSPEMSCIQENTGKIIKYRQREKGVCRINTPPHTVRGSHDYSYMPLYSACIILHSKPLMLCKFFQEL